MQDALEPHVQHGDVLAQAVVQFAGKVFPLRLLPLDGVTQHGAQIGLCAGPAFGLVGQLIGPLQQQPDSLGFAGGSGG